VATIDEVRAIAKSLPRSYEVVVRDRVKFRIGRIVWIAFSRDESLMGFAFPKEERAGLVAERPDTFVMPRPSDLRYNWVVALLDALLDDELEELVVEAWGMAVPKRIREAEFGRRSSCG
jgi:hypothetical protein